MTDLRKAAEMALEAFENYKQGNSEPAKALRQALAQPEHEPVAWADKVGAVIPHSHKLFQPDLLKDYIRPLYMAPPKREWVGLTHEERDEIDQTCRSQMEALFAIEAKLKEKNGG